GTLRLRVETRRCERPEECGRSSAARYRAGKSPCIAPAPAKTGRVRPLSPNVGDQDGDFSRAARMLHKCPLLACPLQPGCRWRYKPRFPGGHPSPLATVRIPSFKVTILLPRFFECSQLGLDLLRRNGTTGAD